MEALGLWIHVLRVKRSRYVFLILASRTALSLSTRLSSQLWEWCSAFERTVVSPFVGLQFLHGRSDSGEEAKCGESRFLWVDGLSKKKLINLP